MITYLNVRKNNIGSNLMSFGELGLLIALFSFIGLVTTTVLWAVKKHKLEVLLSNFILTAIIFPIGLIFFVIFLIKDRPEIERR